MRYSFKRILYFIASLLVLRISSAVNLDFWKNSSIFFWAAGLFRDRFMFKLEIEAIKIIRKNIKKTASVFRLLWETNARRNQLDFRVRNGIGYFLATMTVFKKTMKKEFKKLSCFWNLNMVDLDVERLIWIINHFSGKRIAVIGDLLLDSYVYGVIKRLNPESAAPLLTLDGNKEDLRLGGAGNTALNLCTLGAQVDLYGVIGNDFTGKKIERICKESNLNLIKCYEGQTIEKRRFIETSHNHYLMRVDSGESRLNPVSSKTEAYLLDQFKKNFEEYDGIILSDYDKMIFKGEFGQKIIDLANSLKIISVIDPKPINAKKFLRATLVRPNLSEAQGIVGKKDLSLNTLAKELKQTVQSNSVIITCGSKGMVAYEDKFYQIPTRAREVVDVSGAGDTAGATILLSLVSGANIYQAAEIANYASGVVVEKQGTSTVTCGELVTRIQQEKMESKS